MYLINQEATTIKKVANLEDATLSMVPNWLTTIIPQYDKELKSGDKLFVVNEKNECVHFPQWEHWERDTLCSFPFLIGKPTLKEIETFKKAWSTLE